MPHAPEVDVEIQREAQAREIERAIGRIAERQYGLIARAQLERLGIGARAIAHRLRLRRLHPLHRGVYAVGQRRLPGEARAMAAVLALGDGAVLSHASAAAHWEMVRWTGLPQVTTAARGRRNRKGIRVHERPLPPDEITIHRGIPITTVPRTLFDLAAQVPERLLERAINEAEVRRLWDELSLDSLLNRYPRHPGNRAVRAALRKRREGATVTRSELEERFLRFLDEAGLPRPEVNVLVEGFEVDVLWRAQRVVVELDGRSTHGTAAAFERDRGRDRALQVANWRTIRITAHQMANDALSLVADLSRLLADTV